MTPVVAIFDVGKTNKNYCFSTSLNAWCSKNKLSFKKFSTTMASTGMTSIA